MVPLLLWILDCICVDDVAMFLKGFVILKKVNIYEIFCMKRDNKTVPVLDSWFE